MCNIFFWFQPTTYLQDGERSRTSSKQGKAATTPSTTPSCIATKAATKAYSTYAKKSCRPAAAASPVPAATFPTIILLLLLLLVLLIQLDRCIGSLQQHWGRTTSHLDKQQLSYLGGVGHRASCGRGHWMPLKHAKPRSMALVKWQPPDWADDKLKSLFWNRN